MNLAWISTDTRTGDVIDALPFLEVDRIKRSICRYESATGSLPLPTAPASWEAATREGGATLILLADNAPIWGGGITQAPRDTGDTLEITMATAEAYLDRRYVGDIVYTQVGQNAIVADLVARFVATGPLGGIPIRVVYTSPGKLRDHTYTASSGKTMYSVLRELAGIEGGPEWTIEWERSADHRRITPVMFVGDRIGTAVQAGMAPLVTFAMPGCVTWAEQGRDYSSGKGANAVLATSSGVGDAAPKSALHLAADDGRPTYEHRFQPSSDISELDTLDGHAAAALADLQYGARPVSLTAAMASAPPLGTEWRLGDDLGYDLTGPAFPGGLVGVARCHAWELALATEILTPILIEGN